MPPKQKKVTIFVLNIALANSEIEYLEKGKEVIKRMIERMIFVEPNGEVGIVVIGEPDVEAIALNEIEIASFDMIEKVQNLEPLDVSYENWLDGLNAALLLIERAEVDPRTAKKIILISNFPNSSSDEFKYFDRISDQLIEGSIKFLCYSDEPIRSFTKNHCNNNQLKIREFCDKVEGYLFAFDEILPSLRFYEAADKMIVAWKCMFELADLKFPIRVYVYATKYDQKISWCDMSTKNPDGTMRTEPRLLTKVTEHTDYRREVVDPEDIAQGYMLGEEFLPVGEEDEAGTKLPPEPKSFKLHSFAAETSISIKHRYGNTTWIVIPDFDDENAEEFMYLATSMKNEGLVALVRRVYQVNMAPTMNILEPVLDDPELPPCFLMYELVYAEQEIVTPKVNLEPIIDELSEAERDAVGDLIESMMVDVDEPKPDPMRQYYFDVLSHRALNPDKPIPEPEDEIMAPLRPPSSINMEKAQNLTDNIMYIFEIQPVKMETEATKTSDDAGTTVSGGSNLRPNAASPPNKLPPPDVVPSEETEPAPEASTNMENMFNF